MIGRELQRLWTWVRSKRLPNADYWLWPISEVFFIALFSFIPLLVFAFDVWVRADPPISYGRALGDLLYAGQLMFYAIGFLGSASWSLIHHIQWPRILKPWFLLAIFGATIVFSVTVGVNPTVSKLNADAFREASYWTFGVAILLYLVCEILVAVQPLRTVEAQFKSDEDEFSKKVNAEVAQND